MLAITSLLIIIAFLAFASVIISVNTHHRNWRHDHRECRQEVERVKALWRADMEGTS